ncbi:MAG: biotin--[acetyl-CoA-carboxylase] ligase [Candidatus Hydrogenedentota bacterium]
MSEYPQWAAGTLPPAKTRIVGRKVLVYASVDSTNTTALRVGGDGTIVLAEAQTEGRGRLGRAWHSAAGRGVWVSVAFEGPSAGLPFAGALAVRDALAPLLPTRMKWPNDILAGDRKVAGVLVEHRGEVSAVGMGINVTHQDADFPPELRGSATSVERVTGRSCDRGSVLADLLEQLDRRVTALRNGGYAAIREEWADACDIVGRRVRYRDTVATVQAIDGIGALVLATPQGSERLMVSESREIQPLGEIGECSL